MALQNDAYDAIDDAATKHEQKKAEEQAQKEAAEKAKEEQKRKDSADWL